MSKWEEKKYEVARNNNAILYDAMTSYQQHGDASVFIEVIESLSRENKNLKDATMNFVDKNYHGGAKSDREDYSVMVSCKDIWELRQVLLSKEG